MATKTKSTKITRKAAKKVAQPAIATLWQNKEFRTKMVSQGRKTMSGLWAKRGFRKNVVTGMKAKWADPAFRAMMIERMKAARAVTA
jgi:hypothetical protein